MTGSLRLFLVQVAQFLLASLRQQQHQDSRLMSKNVAKRLQGWCLCLQRFLLQFFHSFFAVLLQFFGSSFTVLLQYLCSSFAVLFQFFHSSFASLRLRSCSLCEELCDDVEACILGHLSCSDVILEARLAKKGRKKEKKERYVISTSVDFHS